MATNNTQLDTYIEVVTPENIAFRYRLAGPSRRLLAYLIDLAIRIGAFIAVRYVVVLALVFVGLPNTGIGVLLLLYFVLDWLYGGLFEAYWNGQTPGKRSLGIRVLSTDGRPIDGMQAMLRNLLRFFDAQPLIFFVVPTYLFGLVAMLSTRRFQRFGDIPSGTIVVIEERTWHAGLVRINDPAAIRLSAFLPAGFQVSRTLREALASYVERRRFFPPARRADIARHVGEPLCRQFGLPPDTDHDLLMCALYHRTFLSDQEPQPAAATGPTIHSGVAGRVGSPRQVRRAEQVEMS